MSKDSQIIPLPTRNERIYSLDAIRALAIIFVIIAHSKLLFAGPDVNNSLYCFLMVIGKIGVPLFVILTGYLMFNRNYEDGAYLKKYLLNNLLPLFAAFEFWNVAFNVLRYTNVSDPPRSWTAVLKAALFMGNDAINSILWFLPMIIAVYLGMPIISTAYRRISSPIYKKVIFFVLIMCGVVIPTISHIYPAIGGNEEIHSVLKMNIFGATVRGESVWMIYVLMGWAISQGKLRSVSTWVLTLAGILFPFGIMFYVSFMWRENYVIYDDFILFVLLSVSLFELLMRAENFWRRCLRLQKVIVRISKISFAIYMLHLYVCGALFILITENLKSLGMAFPPIIDYYSGAANVFFGSYFSGITTVVLYICFILTTIFIINIIAYVFQKSLFIKKYIFLMK